MNVGLLSKESNYWYELGVSHLKDDGFFRAYRALDFMRLRMDYLFNPSSSLESGLESWIVNKSSLEFMIGLYERKSSL